MQGNHSRDTRPEIAVRSALHRTGLRFRKHARPLPSLKCEADVVFPRERIAVFVDGCFWHGCPEHGKRPGEPGGYWHAKLERNASRDRRNDVALKAAGWLVVRVWEHEPPDRIVERVRELVLRRRGEVV